VLLWQVSPQGELLGERDCSLSLFITASETTIISIQITIKILNYQDDEGGGFC
jgi:hypothetical protein